MPDLTAARLHEIIAPVWSKHPGTRPEVPLAGDLKWAEMRSWWPGEQLFYGWKWCSTNVPVEVAELFCEAQMTRWLSKRQPHGIGINSSDLRTSVWLIKEMFGVERTENKPALIEALAATCLAVPDTE